MYLLVAVSLDCTISNKSSDPFHQHRWGEVPIGLCPTQHWPGSVFLLYYMKMPLPSYKLRETLFEHTTEMNDQIFFSRTVFKYQTAV